MWSLIKNIFSVELAFISWANFSWPSTHQSFFGKGNSSLWVSKCQATEQKEREGERGEKQLRSLLQSAGSKPWKASSAAPGPGGVLHARCWFVESAAPGASQNSCSDLVMDHLQTRCTDSLLVLSPCQHQKLAGYFCLGRCTFCCKGLFSLCLPCSQVMFSTIMQEEAFDSFCYGGEGWFLTGMWEKRGALVSSAATTV